MMQNIRNGKPVIFRHDCSENRKGEKMSEDEYYSFLEQIVEKCFTFAEINLERLSVKKGNIWNKFLGKDQYLPTFRQPHIFGSDGYCDFIIAKTPRDYKRILAIDSPDFKDKYTLESGNWLKVIQVKADNVNHPQDFINGDNYTIQLISTNLYPQQENIPLDKPVSDNNMIYEVGQAWIKLNADILEPYLDKDFHYSSDFVFIEISSREEYLYYLRGKFKAFSEKYSNKIKVKYGIIGQEELQKGIFIKMGDDESIPYIEVQCTNGRISAMCMHESDMDPFSSQSEGNDSQKEQKAYLDREHLYLNAKFSFENYDKDFHELNKIAYDCLDNYFESLGMEYGHGWSWLQTNPQQISFQHLCISYKSYVLSIVIGLYWIENGRGKLFVNPQYKDNLLGECQKYNLTPCIFVIDCANGDPLLNAPYLLDARTLEPLNLSELKEDNDGVMSDWEINNIGIQCAYHYLNEQGVAKITYCDVIGITPQLWFEKDGEKCYAFVRSIPAGLSKEKYHITTGNLNRFSESKGYFFNIQWNMVLGSDGEFQDKQMFREHNPWNLVHKLDFKPLEEAIAEYDFIEIVEAESYSIK
jgi:hypothetical protein